MNAFLFSGQGSQYVGMGLELLNANPEFITVFDTASDILGFDLKKIISESSEEQLSRTVYAQPAIMAVSLLCFKTALKNGIGFDVAAGHSLGEYAAMTACGMLSEENGFKVIKARSEAMEKAAQENEGSMAAVLKLSPEKIEQICTQTNGYVVPVNYNSPAQTVIAGEKSAVELASKTMTENGARVMPLKVASAFHSKLMQSAANEFFQKIKNVEFKTPSKPFYSNITGTELKDFSDMPSLLAQHIVSPVKFTSELASMRSIGITSYIELGPNKVLTGLVKKTLDGVTALNIENTATLEAALKSLN